MIIDEIKLLLDLFEGDVPDRESNRLVWKFRDKKQRWIKAHGLYSTLRDRNIKAIKQGDKLRECQYCFEELVAKAPFNLTRDSAAFDPESPLGLLKMRLLQQKR